MAENLAIAKLQEEAVSLSTSISIDENVWFFLLLTNTCICTFTHSTQNILVCIYLNKVLALEENARKTT